MIRIFSTLAVVSTAVLATAFVLGWMIDDPAARDAAAQRGVALHFMIAVAALMSSALVHAVVLTYFMGTGRWLEETSQAYGLPPTCTAESLKLKYRTLPWMAGALVLLIVTGGLGALADPASAVSKSGFGGIPPSTIHLISASVTFAANLFVNLLEYSAIERNSRLVQQVLDAVHRIRTEKGLPVE